MTKKYLGIAALALAVTVTGACEDITNPVEDFGQLVGPYVRVQTSAANVRVGTTALFIVQMPTRVEEDVQVNYAFGGTAVFGEDFRPVDRTGAPRTDVTATGGVLRIPYRFDNTQITTDTLRLAIPATAGINRTIEVEITEARTSSNRTIETGYTEQFRRSILTIRP